MHIRRIRINLHVYNPDPNQSINRLYSRPRERKARDTVRLVHSGKMVEPWHYGEVSGSPSAETGFKKMS